MSIFQTAARALASVRTAAAGVPTVYCRGNLSRAARAAIGHTDYTLEQGDQIVEGLVARDFIYQVAEIREFGDPQPGDVISELDEFGNTIAVYEAMPLAGNRCFRDCDDFRVSVRIHTKRIK